MNIKERIELLSKLNTVLKDLVNENDWSGYATGITSDEYDSLRTAITKAKVHNQWFTKESVLEAIKNITAWLNEKDLTAWTAHYKYAESLKKVAIIMAGNIPLVGFHDLISVFLMGHKAIGKLSSSDKILLPAILKIMVALNPEVEKWITLTEDKLPEFDAVIATGSDNSALYFDSYFGKYPHIIRKNRTSVAVIKGDENSDDLNKLGADIFTFHGLGCRNVSKLLVPKGYKFDSFFESIFDYGDIINHHKYANNYDYNKAVYLMNMLDILDNNFLILKKDDGLHSPLGVLFYEEYESENELSNYLTERSDEIQAVVGKDYIPFGGAQCPSLMDYADGVDTMKFLEQL
ncbi:MAG: acyl-CoA reductase [Putridiphycobacter sp.]